MDKIIIKGARENNLKNIDIDIPKNKLVVMTGLSGSGKSSLAFETIYQEGQRRYVESLSSYARQFIGSVDKPNVDSIEGLSPAISIDQKTTSRNPRSTVGTVTEIYDYFRVLFARIGIPYCPTHQVPIVSQTIEEMVNKILELPMGSKLQILAPVVFRQKGTHKKVFEQFQKEGFVRVRVNGTIFDIEENIDLDKNKKHSVEIVVDRIILKEDSRSRLNESIELAAKHGQGRVTILLENNEELTFSEKFACKECDYTIMELEPRLFSFNAPIGACEECNGLGIKQEVSEDLVIDWNLGIFDGGLIPYKTQDKETYGLNALENVCDHFHIDYHKPFKEYTREELDILLYGSNEKIHFKFRSSTGRVHEKIDKFEGIITNLQRRYLETTSEWIRSWIENYMVERVCSKCQGARLKKEVLSIYINNKNINDLTTMSIADLSRFLENLQLTAEQQQIGYLALKEIKERLSFLINVGLDYLNLRRQASTLSGGEAQRIRLATQIGSRLSGVLYVLDEPSIGLHQRDNHKLIQTMKKMRDLGNTLIVVEHDEDTMLECDHLIDIGPGAGAFGGEVVAQGTPMDVMQNEKSITGRYLSKKEGIPLPISRREIGEKKITIHKACENNLKNITVEFPLGVLTCVTGVSGSGKSSLVNHILYRGIHDNLYKNKKNFSKNYDKITGLEYIDKVIDISQTPIGRTPRSNPATYTGVFDDIRDLFAQTTEAKIRGYNKGRFSFNIKGGRCEACSGDGIKRISMHFLPDVFVPCEVCHGLRYNQETLQIKYKNKNIAEVLDLTIAEALQFFENIPRIKACLQTIYDVGLGYIRLGQAATTLSGGEAQRVKLATELNSRITDRTLYILDEPTTGLHIDDIKRLMVVINRIVDSGASVVIIEHNLDVIKLADHIIDLGKEGGDGGGEILYTGDVYGLAKCKDSYTGYYLKKYLE